MRAYATRKLFRISQTSLHVLLYVYVVTTLRNVLCIHATTVKNCNHMKSLFSGILRITNWTLRLSLCQNVLANSLEKVYCLCYFWYKSLNSHVMQNHVFHFRIQIRICCYFCKIEEKFSILCQQFLDIVFWSVITFSNIVLPNQNLYVRISSTLDL